MTNVTHTSNLAEFNSCAGLVSEESLKAASTAYDAILASGKDPFDEMLQMQKSLQKKLANEKPEFNIDPDEVKTAGMILDWLRMQDDSINDEIRELYTSLGGMSNGVDASAVWKRWKSRHGELRNVVFTEMVLSDRLEVLFEMIDQFHFILNKFMVLGIDGRTLFELYFLKNAENFARQDRNY